MADNNHSKTRSKLRSNKEDRNNKSRVSRDESKYYYESKTPPLPIKSNCSISELLKQRDSLKKELKDIKPGTLLEKKNVQDDKKFSSRKRYNNKDIDDNIRKKKLRTPSPPSNYQDDFQIESEDEETIIEQRRKQRKRLLEKLTYSQGETNVKNEVDMAKRMENLKSRTENEKSEQLVGADFPVESEDEETIIEQRRKQRKQLLEKLTYSQGETNVKNEVDMAKKIENLKSRTENEKSQQVVGADEEHSGSKISADMFAEKDEFTSHNSRDNVTQDNEDDNTQLNDNWDDSEGYYNVKVGDMINSSRYTIKNTLGQGVFANVVNSVDNKANKNVAIKIVRNNELMYKTGLKEISVLKEVNEADPDDKYHCIRLFGHFMHKGHLCIVLEPLHMDLRCVIKKYGKHHGINMKALMSYSRQLLLALRHLKKIGFIHADIKPDNILVNEKKSVLKLCDFGSAVKVNDNDATPYLVSRFYRAPEIILGMPYQHGVDLWSTACTIYEMATGKIMFTGSSNNKMLKCFMDMKGKFPNRLIRKGKFKDQHFNYNNNYLLHKKDEATGREKVVEMSNIIIKRDLAKELKKSCKCIEDELKMGQLHDLLDRMVMLDPKHRISITDSIKHPFIQEQLHKY